MNIKYVSFGPGNEDVYRAFTNGILYYNTDFKYSHENITSISPYSEKMQEG